MNFKLQKYLQSSSPITMEWNLKVNNKKKFGKLTIMQKLNNIILNNEWIKEIKGEIIKYFEMKRNKDSTYQNLYNGAKKCLE